MLRKGEGRKGVRGKETWKGRQDVDCCAAQLAMSQLSPRERSAAQSARATSPCHGPEKARAHRLPLAVRKASSANPHEVTQEA